MHRSIMPFAAFALTALASHAHAQLLVTSVTASFPDPNGKLPGFNLVPGAGISNWSMGVAQGVLTHGQSYNYCVSLASGNNTGKATVSFKISRGSTIIQSATIIKAAQYPVGPFGTWYFCSGYKALPSNPGAATLTATAAFTAGGARKAVTTKLAVPVVLQ